MAINARITLVALAAAVCLLVGVAATSSSEASSDANDHFHDHAHDHSDGGLGDYGKAGPIRRELLPAGAGLIVSDEAISLAASAALAPARAAWDGEIDFVDQIDYQLKFRAKVDYLSADPRHLNSLLLDRPTDNYGYAELRLYLTDGEVAEMQRRLNLGNEIELLTALVGGVDMSTLPEGEPPTFASNFSGIWQDQLNRGAIVLSVIDRSELDLEAIYRIVDEKDLRIVEADYSKSEMTEFRDRLAVELRSLGIDFDLSMIPVGDEIPLVLHVEYPDLLPEGFGRDVPADAFEIAPGGPLGDINNPQTLHYWSKLQPGLAILVNDYQGTTNSACTWGFNGHTIHWNYVITAGHCMGQWRDYKDWHIGDGRLEISQSYSNSFPRLLTPGNVYLHSVDEFPYDGARFSSIYADDNCYHGSGSTSVAHCEWPMERRALHNSWEINSDQTCMSLGASNTYRCGFIIELNVWANDVARVARTDIQIVGGDSGAGAKLGHWIDGILVKDDSSGRGLFQTAYDEKTQLVLDFNCAVGETHKPTASTWSPCPTINR